MDKDDSNGSSFEIVEKPEIKNVTPAQPTVTTGNLLSNVAPPSSIPDFTLWTSNTTTVNNPSNLNTDNNIVTTAPVLVNQFPSPQFSAAIPPSKGIPQEALFKRSPPAEAEVASSSFFGFVKDSLNSNVVSKMVEKAKNSVDSLITTLDPQMSEYIYSSGDLKIVVTSEDDDVISAVRQAAHSVIGKAYVNGLTDIPSLKTQPVGIENGIKEVEKKIALSLQTNPSPTIGVENILIKQGRSWYDVTLLILKDPDNELNLQVLSQSIPVPVNKFLGPEVADIDVENKLAEYLKAVPCWQEEVSGVPRKEVIHLAAKVLLKFYKDSLPEKYTASNV